MKKILAIMLIIAMMFSFVACGDDETAADKVKTPEELMDKVMEESGEFVNGEFAGHFELEMSGLEELGFAGPMSLDLTGQMFDEKNMMFDMQIDAGIGMIIAAKLYMTEDQMLIDMPFLATMLGYQYMSMDLASVYEMAGTEMAQQDADKVMEILERFQDETEHSIYDVLVLDDSMDEEEITINEEKVDVTKISMSVSLEDAIDLLYAFMDFIANDEEAKELLLAEMTQEDIDMMLEEMDNPETRAEIEAVLEMVDIKSFNIDYYINADFVPVKFDVLADMSIEAEGEVLDMKLTGNFEYFNMNGVEEIEIPEVDPSQVMDLTDMTNMY
jgi:hypothetical protein